MRLDHREITDADRVALVAAKERCEYCKRRSHRASHRPPDLMFSIVCGPGETIMMGQNGTDFTWTDAIIDIFLAHTR
jgi:hypothetical protein